MLVTKLPTILIAGPLLSLQSAAGRGDAGGRAVVLLVHLLILSLLVTQDAAVLLCLRLRLRLYLHLLFLLLRLLLALLAFLLLFCCRFLLYFLLFFLLFLLFLLFSGGLFFLCFYTGTGVISLSLS